MSPLPFCPPAEYSFEPELRGPAPRELPDSIREGYFEKFRRTACRRCFVTASVFVVIWSLSVWLQWAQRFPPLRYLCWGSVPFFSLGTWHVTRRILSLGPYRYIQEGMPLVARVRELVRLPTLFHNGEPTAYAFQALIECHDPQSGKLCTSSVKSRDFSSPQQYTTSFKVDDYVTAVYLPNNFPASLRLYAFLDLSPELGIVASSTAIPVGRRWLKRLVTVVATVLLFAVLLWNLLAFQLYLPIDLSLTMLVPIILGSIVLGGSIGAAVMWEHRKRGRLRDEANRVALASGAAISIGPLDALDQPGVGGWARSGGHSGTRGTDGLVLGYEYQHDLRQLSSTANERSRDPSPPAGEGCHASTLLHQVHVAGIESVARFPCVHRTFRKRAHRSCCGRSVSWGIGLDMGQGNPIPSQSGCKRARGWRRGRWAKGSLSRAVGTRERGETTDRGGLQ